MIYKHYFILLIFILAGCQSHIRPPEVPPPPIPQCLPASPVRVALVLGGGGAKGMSHVGVLTELENAGIPIDVIIGCSAGSIVGALYADHHDADSVKKILKPLTVWNMIDINFLYGRYGIARGNYLKKFLQRNLFSANFEELQIPLYVVATDLATGKLVAIAQDRLFLLCMPQQPFLLSFLPLNIISVG